MQRLFFCLLTTMTSGPELVNLPNICNHVPMCAEGGGVCPCPAGTGLVRNAICTWVGLEGMVYKNAATSRSAIRGMAEAARRVLTCDLIAYGVDDIHELDHASMHGGLGTNNGSRGIEEGLHRAPHARSPLVPRAPILGRKDHD